VDLDHGVPLVLGHVHKHAIAQNACIQDNGIELAEGGDRLVDHALGAVPVGDVVTVRDSLAAHRLDLVDDLLGGADIVALAGAVAAEVIHHDLGAMFGQHQAVFAADAAGASSDDRHPTLTQSCHCSLPSFACLEWIVLR
jgi:hypothetical protein